MGCSGSKEKKPKEAAKQENANGAASKNEAGSAAGNSKQKTPQAVQPSPSNKSVEVPAGRAVNPNDVNISNTDVGSTAAPANVARRANSDASAADVDENGNPVVLPKGDWIKTEGTPYYYSALENLYYHPPSCQFYDPTNEMWYDPEKDEWYHDDGSDEEAAAA